VDILWSHITQHSGQPQQILGVYHNDIVHYLSVNAQNQPLSYEIIKHPTQLKNGVTWVDLHSNIQWVPSAFAQSDIPGMPQPKIRKINAQQSLAFQYQPQKQNLLATDAPAMHIAEGLYTIAQTYASHKEYMSVIWFHDQTAIVFAFHNNQLVFANKFNSSNTQEHLYFALLPFHQKKLTPAQLGLIVLCDAHQHQNTAQLFHKFIPHAEIQSPSMPWIVNAPAPLQHIVSPLIKMISCASPVEA